MPSQREREKKFTMTILSLTNIHKRFGPTVALDGVNLQMRQGEVHALIGENGAGKSTLMNVLAGLIHADEGEMSVEGTAYVPANPLDARERGIGLIHQELSLFPHLSVAENIMMGIEPSRFGVLDAKSLAQRTNEVLATFHHPEITPSARVILGAFVCLFFVHPLPELFPSPPSPASPASPFSATGPHGAIAGAVLSSRTSLSDFFTSAVGVLKKNRNGNHDQS